MATPAATIPPITISAVLSPDWAFLTPAGLPAASGPTSPAKDVDAIKVMDSAAATRFRMRYSPVGLSFFLGRLSLALSPKTTRPPPACHQPEGRKSPGPPA